METSRLHSVSELVCQTLRRHSESIQKHLDGAAEGKDPESIHQVRVGCRRLRTALRVFVDCLDASHVRRWRKETKRLLKSLRQVRDVDIQLLFLDELLKEKTAQNKKIQPGINRLVLRLGQKREDLQKAVRKAIERFRKQNILMDIRLETERLLWDYQSQPSEAGSGLTEIASRAVREVLEETTGRLGCLQNRKDIQGHHRLRIAIKHLRYTLEIFEPVYEEGLERFIKPLKKMQTLLGDLNDCAGWAEWIETFCEKEKKRTEKFFGHTRPFRRLEAGLEFVRRHRRKQWRALFKEVCAESEKLEKEGFWKRLSEWFEISAKPTPPAPFIEKAQGLRTDEPRQP